MRVGLSATLLGAARMLFCNGLNTATGSMSRCIGPTNRTLIEYISIGEVINAGW